MGAGETRKGDRAQTATGSAQGAGDNTVEQRSASTLPTTEEINFADDNKPEPEEKPWETM
jgi:hypothetical protein